MLAEADFAGLQFLQQCGEPPARPPPLRLHLFMHVLYISITIVIYPPPEAYSIHETVRPGRTGPVLKSAPDL